MESIELFASKIERKLKLFLITDRFEKLPSLPTYQYFNLQQRKDQHQYFHDKHKTSQQQQQQQEWKHLIELLDDSSTTNFSR